VSVEARLGEAILDLEGRLVEGMDIASAIRETAEDHYFKDEVIRIRAARLLGPLELVKAKSDQRMAEARGKLAFKAAVDAYNEQDVNCSMRDWLIEQLGHDPSYEELKVAFAQSTGAWLLKHMEDFKN
jgi:hypothetical protein